jgi:hypothetical protein
MSTPDLGWGVCVWIYRAVAEARPEDVARRGAAATWACFSPPDRCAVVFVTVFTGMTTVELPSASIAPAFALTIAAASTDP